MEGKKLKYPRKVVIEAGHNLTDITLIVDFANRFKYSERAKVKIEVYKPVSLMCCGATKACITFYTLEPRDELRANFGYEMDKAGILESVFIDGCYYGMA